MLNAAFAENCSCLFNWGAINPHPLQDEQKLIKPFRLSEILQQCDGESKFLTSSQPCITLCIVSCLGPMHGPKSYTKVPILQVVISFRMKLWPVALFFHSLLESGNMQNIAPCHFLYCCEEMTCCNVVYVPRFQKWVKKRGNRSEFHSERN